MSMSVWVELHVLALSQEEINCFVDYFEKEYKLDFSKNDSSKLNYPEEYWGHINNKLNIFSSLNYEVTLEASASRGVFLNAEFLSINFPELIFIGYKDDDISCNKEYYLYTDGIKVDIKDFNIFLNLSFEQIKNLVIDMLYN